MNKYEAWEDIISKNNLIVTNFTFEEIDKVKKKENKIQFHLSDSTGIISQVTQYFYQESAHAIFINKKNYYDFFKEYIEEFKNFKFYQKLYITYISDNEANIFKLKIGHPIIIIEKKMTIDDKLVFLEEELSKIEKYYFQEINTGG